MASLGELTARAILDIAQFSGPLSKAEKEVVDFGKSIDKTFSEMGSKIGGTLLSLTAGFASVSTVMQQFSESVDIQAQIHDIASVTGEAVEELDKLAIVAKLNGTDLATMQKAMKELNKSLVEAKEPGSQAAEIFKALGVSASDLEKMKPAEQMKVLTEAFAKFPDDASKAVAMQDLFGKSSKDAALIMKNYADDMERANTITEKFGGTSKETAAAADAIGDNMDAMAMGLQHALMPAFTSIADLTDRLFDAFAELGGQTGNLAELMGNALVFSIKILVSGFIGLITPVTMAIALLKGVAEVMQNFGDWDQMKRAASDAGDAVMKAARDSSNALDKLWSDSLPQTKKATDEAMKSTEGLANAHNKGGAAAKANAKALKEQEAAAKKAAEEVAKLAARWTDYVAAAGDPKLVKYNNDMAELDRLIKDKPDQINEWTQAQLKLTQAFIDAKQVDINKEWKELNNTVKDAPKLNDDWEKAVRKSITAMEDHYFEMKKSVDQYGKTTAEIRLMNIELEYQATISLPSATDKQKAYAKQLRDMQIDMANTITKQEEWGAMMETADRYGKGLFDSMQGGLKGVSDWAKQTGQDLKKYLLDLLYQATLKPFIISIVGGVAGTAGASTGAGSPFGAAAGGGGGLNSLTSLAGMASGLVDSFGALSFAAADFTQLVAGGTGVMEAFSMATAGASLTLASALPVIGAIAAVGYLAYQYFNSQGGGPKKGGAAGTTLHGADLFPGETGSEGNKVVGDIVKTIDESYANILKSLGGKGSAAFGMAYDTDPEGKANNRLNASAMVNGRPVYTYKSGDDALGRDMDVLSGAMELEAKRMLLAALQASDLPDDIAKIMNSVSAANITSDGLDNLLTFAQSVGSINATIASFDDLGEALDKLAAGTTRMDAFRTAGESLDSLTDSYDGSADATVDLTKASQAYYAAMVQLEVQIRQVAAAADKMFADTAKDINLYGRDWAYMQEYYTKQWTSDMGALAAETDPEKIAELANSINQGIKGAFDAVDMSDWKPEDIEARRKLFVGYAEDANKAVQDRLKIIGDDVATNTKNDLKQVHDLMMDAATNMNAAATSMANSAATPIKATVDGPMEVIIVGDDRTSEVTG